MTQRKRIFSRLIIYIFCLILLVTVIIIIRNETDSLKNKSEMFMTHFEKIVENAEYINTIFKDSILENYLQSGGYEEKIEIRVADTNMMDTTAENRNSEINKYKVIKIKEKIPQEEYATESTAIERENKKIFELKEIKNKDKYYIKFPELYKQYFTGKDMNLKKMQEEIGYKESEIVIDKHSRNLNNKIQLSPKELKNDIKEYLKVIKKHINQKEIYRNKNKKIEINNKSIQTNEYGVIFTKEELNNMVIEILEEAKEDEKLLYKLGKNKKSNQKIDKLIEKIKNTNIGIEKNEIIINEYKGKTCRIIIGGDERKIEFDIIPSEKYVKLINYEEKKEKYFIQVEGNNSNLDAVFKDNDKKIEKEYKILTKEEKETVVKKEIYRYRYDNNQIETEKKIRISKKENQVGEIPNKKEIVDFEKINKEQKERILARLKQKIDDKIETVKENINRKELIDSLFRLGILTEQDIIKIDDFSEKEVERENYKFEIIKSNNISVEKVLELLDIVKEKIESIEKMKDGSLKIKIMHEREGKNIDYENEVKEKIEKKNVKDYNLVLNYNEENKLVNEIIIQSNKEKR